MMGTLFFVFKFIILGEIILSFTIEARKSGIMNTFPTWYRIYTFCHFKRENPTGIVENKGFLRPAEMEP